MSINDEIGDLSGGQLHIWFSERSDAIIDNFVFDETRSDIQFETDATNLPQEVLAFEIARQLYGNRDFEFGQQPTKMSTQLVRVAVESAYKFKFEKAAVGYFGGPQAVIPAVTALSYLRFAFDAGATPADLLAWGVDPFTVIQLIWWQAKPGETRLEQHIRATRNGWGLVWLSHGIRATYAMLLKQVDQAKGVESFVAKYDDDIADVRKLNAFFDETDRHNELLKKNRDEKVKDAEPEAVGDLTPDQQIEWAKAFAAAGTTKILPDAKGRWGRLPAQGLEAGQLREPALTVARFFNDSGFAPSDWGKKIKESWFVRVGDK